MNVTFTVEDLAAAADAAMPYAMDGDTRLRSKLCRSARRPGRHQHLNCEHRELARLHLDKGEFEGQRLLSPTLIQELQTPRVHEAAPAFAEHGDMHLRARLPLAQLSRRARCAPRRRLDRLGYADGDAARSWRRCAVFTNRDPTAVPEILANYVFDRVCGKEPIPWLDRYRELRRKALVQLDVDRQARNATRRPNTGLAMSSRTMPVITTIPATAGSQSPMPKAN